ncbi:MAGE family protein [Hirsutella rhossiliensis]|uniref:MAGE family domain-containing protein n=1 Tax=Hirsutella rhossiliensis TaxID=111463 RepID=A0A9P8MXR9_9HYPO|nr:MAGE family domain-containing protein [Hirsutella rhossiliensis]KAH0964283.1 MAGE family domain-containing protein [Hirsutella rhossiliensis]
MPPSQRRRRPIDDDESDQDARPRQRPNRNGSGDEAGDESGDGMDGNPNQDADRQLAKKLVRYAISCEYSRTPIRRDGIKERVLGNQGRSFKRVFVLAQKQLREIWGMELRELPVREKMSLQEKRQAMKSSSQIKTGSGAYLLTSNLPEPYRSATILKPSRIPNEEDEATYAAFYTLVVALIWLNSGELSEQKLRRYLMRLNADQNVSNEKTDMTLKRMEKHGYVIKKVERPPIGQDGDQNVTWHIGPRAKEEIGLDGVMGMVREVFGDWSPDLEKKLRSSLGLKAQPTAANEDAVEAGGGGRQAADGSEDE